MTPPARGAAEPQVRFFGEDADLDFARITDTEIRGFFENRYSVVEKMLEEHFGDM